MRVPHTPSPTPRTGYPDQRTQQGEDYPEQRTRERGALQKPARDYRRDCDSSDTKDVPRSYYTDYSDRENHQSDRSRSERQYDRSWADSAPPLPKQKFSTDYRTVSSWTPRPYQQRYSAISGNEYSSGRYGMEKSATEAKRTATDDSQVETARKRSLQAWDTDLLFGRQDNETATQANKDKTAETRRNQTAFGQNGHLDTRDPRDIKILSDLNNARVAAVNSLMEGGATYEEAYAATRDMADCTRLAEARQRNIDASATVDGKSRVNNRTNEYRQQPEDGYLQPRATEDLDSSRNRDSGSVRSVEPGEICDEDSIRSKPIDRRMYSAGMSREQSGDQFVKREEETSQNLFRGPPKAYDMADAFLKKVADGMKSPYKTFDRTRISCSPSPSKSRARSRSPAIRNRERGRSATPRAQRNEFPTRRSSFPQLDSPSRHYRSRSVGGSSRHQDERNKSYDQRREDQAPRSRDHQTDRKREKFRSRDEISPVKASYVGRRGSLQSSPGPVRKYSVDHRRDAVVYSVDHRAPKRHHPYLGERRHSFTADRSREVRKQSPGRGRSEVTGRTKGRAPTSDHERDRRSRSRSVPKSDYRDARPRIKRDLSSGDGRRSPYEGSGHHPDRGRDFEAAREFEQSGERSSLQTRRNKDGERMNGLDRGEDRERNSGEPYRHRGGNLDIVTLEKTFDGSHCQIDTRRDGEPEHDGDRVRKRPGTDDRATYKDASRDRDRDASRMDQESEIQKNSHRNPGMFESNHSAFPADRGQQAAGEHHGYRRDSLVAAGMSCSSEPQQLAGKNIYPPSFFSQIPRQGHSNPAYPQIPAHPEYSMQTPILYQTISQPPGNNFDQQNLGIAKYSSVQVLTPQNHLVSVPTPGVYVATPNVVVNHPPSQIMNRPGVVYIDAGGRYHSSDLNPVPMYHVMDRTGTKQPLHGDPASTHLPHLEHPVVAMTFLPNPALSREPVAGYVNRYGPPNPNSRDPHGMLVRSTQQVLPHPNVQVSAEPPRSRPAEFGWSMIEYVDGLMNRLRRDIIPAPQFHAAGAPASDGNATVPKKENVDLCSTLEPVHSGPWEPSLTIDTNFACSKSSVGDLQNYSLTYSPPTAGPPFRQNTFPNFGTVSDSTTFGAPFNSLLHNPDQPLPSTSPDTSTPRLENLGPINGMPAVADASRTRTDELSQGALYGKPSSTKLNITDRELPSLPEIGRVMNEWGRAVESDGKNASTKAIASRSRSVTPLKGVIVGERIVYNETDWSVEELRAEHTHYQS